MYAIEFDANLYNMRDSFSPRFALDEKSDIVVRGDRLTIYHLFGKTETVRFTDLDRAVEGSKGQIEIFKGGKKIITVDLLCDNYDLLCDSLSSYGKLAAATSGKS